MRLDLGRGSEHGGDRARDVDTGEEDLVLGDGRELRLDGGEVAGTQGLMGIVRIGGAHD
ncbi:hypothetical protein D3C83_146310 [compost metagenome]